MHVERVDRLIDLSGDPRRRDVQPESRERARDQVEQAQAVGTLHLEHRVVIREVVVEGDLHGALGASGASGGPALLEQGRDRRLARQHPAKRVEGPSPVRRRRDGLADGIVDLEGVDGDAVAARVDLGRDDVHALRGERARDQREEAGQVPGDDDEIGRTQIGVVEQLGHDGRVAQRLEHLEMLGHPLHAGGGQVAVGHHRQVRLDRLRRQLFADGLAQPIGELGTARALAASAGEPGERALVELVQDRRLPRREDAGADRPHVGPGEQVEHLESLRIAGGHREVRDGLGIVDVTPLSDVRHREVVGHQELDQRALVARKVDPRDQLADQRNALRDVAMPAGLADVVQQHAEHEELGLLDLAEHLRGALRLGGLAGRQRLEVLDGEQRVLVDREFVVDVVLHQARQRAELRQEPSEQSELVHFPERLRDAPPRPADVEEQIANGRRTLEGAVHEVERVLERPLEIERQLAAEAMQVPEDFHEPGRIGAQRARVAIDQMQLAVEEHEPVGQRLLPLAPAGRAASGQSLLTARDQPARHAVDRPRVQIVVAHEALDAERRLVVPVAEVLRDPRLEIAREHVVLVAREEMELVPHSPEEGQRRVGRGLLARRDEPLVGELAQGSRPELGGAQPHRGVYVAQTARRLLHVGLADVRRGAVAAVALVALRQGRLEELGEVAPVDVLAQHLAEAAEEPPVAGQEPCLLHRRAAREVRSRHRHAVVERAQAMADL